MPDIYTLNDFVGQKNLKNQLSLAIQSALQRGTRLDHVLLVGNPGFGKTTLGGIIAEEMMVDYESFIMPIEPRILQGLMSEFDGVVLLDEIHRCPARQQELLLPILEYGYMQTKSGHRIENNVITFVAATTQGDDVVEAVRDRFPIRPVLDEYSDEEMAQILGSMAVNADVAIPSKAQLRLAKATLGVPRNARIMVNTWRDLELRDGTVNVDKVLATLRLSPTGLGAEHRRYCEMLGRAGGQAGLNLMKELMSMPAGSVEQIEIDLIKQGLLERQSNGRILTGRGYELIGTRRFGRTQRNGNER